MSQDLFAAFGETPSTDDKAEQSVGNSSFPWNSSSSPSVGDNSGHYNGTSAALPNPNQGEDDDDFGDFEDAAVPQSKPTEGSRGLQSGPRSIPPSERPQKSSPFPPKAQKKTEPRKQDSKIGKHPFAGHMDFLFEAGDDEYDAGADDLENLANNPEAAMAYSKRLIAEQQAKSTTPKTSLHGSQNEGSQAVGHTKTPSAAPASNHARSESQGKTNKLTKVASKTPTKSLPPNNPNPPAARNKLKKKSGYTPARDPNVLFDADDPSEADDDDWGDFESGPTISISNVGSVSPVKPHQSESSMPAIDLLGLDEPAPPKLLGQVGRSRSASLRTADQILGPPKHTPSNSLSGNEGNLIDDNPWADFNPEVPRPTASVPTAPVSSGAEDDAWDDFEEAVPTKAAYDITSSTSNPPSANESSLNRAPSESLVPPTNIPPPVLLLSIFPSIFSAAQDALFVPLSRLDTAQRQELLSHHATHQFLRSYLTSATTLAHIIAGRKLRWKRDQILSQSMRIGPAAAGGKGGMKLAGIDKSEVVKEEREVLDAVRLWKGQAGKLRGAVTTATSSSGGNVKFPPVPDISETMPVKTLKSIEGGFVAPHQCALCGLKREERAQKVDIDIDDSFGEWWVNGMDMHVTCRNWWEENKAKLRSR